MPWNTKNKNAKKYYTGYIKQCKEWDYKRGKQCSKNKIIYNI